MSRDPMSPDPISPEMDDFEATLAHSLRDLVDGEHPSDDLRTNVLEGITATPARPRFRLVPAAAAAALVVVALLGAVVMAGSDDDDMDVATDPAPSTTEAPQVLGDQVTRVPDGSIPPQTTVPATIAPTTTTAPAVTTTVAPAVAPAPPTTAAPAPRPAPAPAPAPAPEPTTGSITVEVATADGADRYVTLLTAEGEVLADRVPVTGDPIVFDDLQPGSYEVRVEEVRHTGGDRVTKTVVTVDAGEDVVLRCHPDSLDCSR